MDDILLLSVLGEHRMLGEASFICVDVRKEKFGFFKLSGGWY